LEHSHRYLPAGEHDFEEMLAAIGVSSVEELFASLPAAIRLDHPLPVEGPLSDQELRRHFRQLEARNRVHGRDLTSFLGAGAYRHDTPAVADHLIQRGEYLTVYTPYQPEISQGTLQAIFEFQTFMTLLTGLPAANASLYDGASAFAEAVLMAARIKKKRRKVVISRGIHPHYRQTLATYATNLDLEVVEAGWDEAGRTDLTALAAAVDASTLAVAVQSPNYFGAIEPWAPVSEVAHAAGALSIGVVAEALSLALLTSPGDGGCDIVCGEGQSFGLPLAFGGPYLGFLSTRSENIRAMPGRLVGETVDSDGKRAWVLTLATREQHIRREKATSNICTNVALCALIGTLYLSLHGRRGLRRLAEINLQRTAALSRRLGAGATGLSRRFTAPSFNEVAFRCVAPVAELIGSLEAEGILAGVPLGPDYPELDDSFILAVTEANPPEDLDRLVTAAEQLHARRQGRQPAPAISV